MDDFYLGSSRTSVRTSPKVTNPKATAVKNALQNRDPFYTGMCTLREHGQGILYYTDGDLHRRIDFSNATPEELDVLYHACKPADYDGSRENASHNPRRKARTIDITSFSPLFDPHNHDIYQQISMALLPDGHVRMGMKLNELSVYGKGDFFKRHIDTPRSKQIFGILVVVLPTAYEGGQLVLRQAQKEWTIDFTEDFASTKEPSVCFVAFDSGLEHETLPVTSGYHVTLTYNLYKPNDTIDPGTSLMPTPFHDKLQGVLCELVNDRTTLPKGGYLGFGLVHQYPLIGRDLLGQLPSRLRGVDRVLMKACDALDLDYSFKICYMGYDTGFELNLLATFPLDISGFEIRHNDELFLSEYIEMLLADDDITIEDVEAVLPPGGAYDSDDVEPGLESVCKEPITEMLEVTKMNSSVSHTSSIGSSSLDGSACLVVALEQAKTRQVVQVEP